jgi:predicted acylesterase/phospholipase RssA
MGLTLIRKSDGARPVANPTVALVLAGGRVTGGAFKVGGLKALNDFLVDRKITDLDLYVGLSAGAILGSSLARASAPTR